MQADSDWDDNALRFGVLCAKVAAAAGTPLAGTRTSSIATTGRPALTPAYSQRARRALLTIHNLAFQGNFERSLLARLGLPAVVVLDGRLEFHGRLRSSRAGWCYADAINTVSPTYAREIQTAEFGCGLDGLLRHRSGA